MWGGAAAIRKLEQIEKFEATREKRIATINEGGRSVEYLMVKCENCGQPWPRQQVLRFDEREFQEWKAIEGAYSSSTLWMVVAPFAIASAAIITTAIFTDSPAITVGITVILIVAAILGIYFFFVMPREKRFREEAKERKRHILLAHGNIPEEKVGTSYWTEYVILPAESSGAPTSISSQSSGLA